MNEIDPIKELRLQEERKFLNDTFVLGLAKPLLERLVQWANLNIFTPLAGELECRLSIDVRSAGVNYSSLDPLRPVIHFGEEMLREIYADAFSFPVFSRRLAEENGTAESLHLNPRFQGKRFLITGGTPALEASDVVDLFRPVCAEMMKAIAADSESQIRPGEVLCRFVMFELMIVWTFFHELGHVVQRHIRLRTGDSTNWADIFYEIPQAVMGADHADSRSETPTTQDLRRQARELMADAEGMDLTAKYLLRGGRFTARVVYLLLCSIGCMYQRFYRGYPGELLLSPHSHPHPVVRDDVSNAFAVDIVYDVLTASKQAANHEEAATAATYLSVRSSLFAGLFRSERIERRTDASTLPSFMHLQSEAQNPDMLRYLQTLAPHVEEQVTQVVGWHLLQDNRVNDWLALFKRRAQ